MSSRRSKFARSAALLRLGAIVLGAAIVVLFARQVNWVAARHALDALGFRAPLVILPYLVTLACDTLGWHALFEHAQKVSVTLLFRVRIATDAVINSLPGGSAIGEALKVVLLKRCFELNAAAAVANIAVSKVGIALAQALFLVCGIALTARDLSRYSVHWIGHRGLEYYALGIALLFVVLALTVAIAIQSGALLRLLEKVRQVAGTKWQERLRRVEAPIARIDHGLAVIRRLPAPRILGALALFFAGYLGLACEDWVILNLLGTPLSFAHAIALAAIVSVVRVMFFFLPSGIFAQEIGYYGLLKMYGVADVEVIAAVFFLVKRCKDLTFFGLGYSCLGALPARIAEVRPTWGQTPKDAPDVR